MVKKITLMNKSFNSSSSNIWTLETLIALILAILILFDIKIERQMRELINTPIGIVVSLLFTIILFISMHPIIGILFIIYLYDTIIRTKNPMDQTHKNNTLNLLNSDLNEIQVEEEIINDNAPIINKNKDNNVSYKPFLEKEYSMY